MNALPPLAVIVGDTHYGSSVASCLPTYELRPGHVVNCNAVNSWLYSRWCDFWDVQVMPKVIDRQGKKLRHLFVFHTGDVIDGIHHGGNELLVRSLSGQKKIALSHLTPIREYADWFGACKGTEAHDTDEHETSTEIFDTLNVDEYAQKMKVWVGDSLIDVAHHGRSKSSPWTSAASNTVSKVVMDCALNGEDVPNYIFRGHRHIIDDSGLQFENVRAIIVPCWQLSNNFGWKVSAEKQTDIGGVILDDQTCKIVRYKPAREKASRPSIRTKPTG